jgi:hypothetical protein
MRALSNTALVEQAARKALSVQELEKTLNRFRQLCVTAGEVHRPLEETAETLKEAGFKHELMQILRESLALPEANPHVGALWMRRVVTSKVWDHRYPAELDSLCRQGEIGHRAVIEFLDLAGGKRRGKLVRHAVSRHAKWLRSQPDGWAAVGRALAQSRCYAQAAKWMSNWKEQSDLDLPTLQCLVQALRATGRSAMANEVNGVALKKAGSGEEGSIFRLYAAEDEVFAGNAKSAALTFKQINNSGWDDDSLALYYLLRGVIRVEKSEPAGKLSQSPDLQTGRFSAPAVSPLSDENGEDFRGAGGGASCRLAERRKFTICAGLAFSPWITAVSPLLSLSSLLASQGC